MGSANSRRVFFAVLAVVTTATLVYFGTGLRPLWPLLWFAPLPVLLFAPSASWWGTALVAFFGWSLGALNLQHYFGALLHVPVATQLIIFATPALVFMAAVSLFRALSNRGAWWSALLAIPATYTTFEYLLSLTSPHGTAGSLAYSELNFLPFLQLASVTGPWGMTFFLLIFSSSVAIAIHSRGKASKQGRRIFAVTCGTLICLLIFGVIRLSTIDPGPRVKVGLVASDAPENQDVAHEGAETERLFRDYAAQAEMLAAKGAQLIVLPEKLGVIVDSNLGDADAILQSAADKTSSIIVAGLVEVAPSLSYNQARVYTPHLPVERYNKHHMLPPFESHFEPGKTLTLLPKHTGTWGVMICKDLDFTPLSRNYGRHSAGLLLVPAWDFVLDRWSHGHIAVMRGVENGFSIVRAARQGYLTVSDNRGRILAETQSDSAQFATLLAEVPAEHETTIYQLFGDWFAWLAIVILIFTAFRSFRPAGQR